MDQSMHGCTAFFVQDLYAMSAKAMSQSQLCIEKRERLLKVYREKDAYQVYLRQRWLDESLPGTPRTDVPKRQWERSFYAWRTCVNACSELGQAVWI